MGQEWVEHSFDYPLGRVGFEKVSEAGTHLDNPGGTVKYRYFIRKHKNE